jgi:hypothetical protein
MTQAELIIQRLKKGWTSPLDALYSCGTLKLATRVGELRRDGFEIEDRWKEENGKRFKEYKFGEVS